MVRHNVLRGLYEVEKTIGCGGFAKVKLATHLATGEKVAIKIMNKNVLGDDLPRVKLELEALKSFAHEHICKLYQVIETDVHFFIIMEYCSGGELFDHIVEKNRLTESESRMFFRQIVSAVAYLHSQGYAHRDLKPENVLLDKNQHLKLIDFGLCARPEGGMQNPLFTSCGSPTYAAPELVLGKRYLGPEVDVWAMGVLLYALLAGSLPFDDLNIDNLYKKILSGKYDEPNFMSKESRKLIRSMLQIDPKKRITVQELRSHLWLTLGVLDPVSIKGEDFKTFDEDCLKAMAKYYQVDVDVMHNYLKKSKYDYHTATYNLLLMRKKRGSALRLYNVPIRFTSDKNGFKTNSLTPSADVQPIVVPREKMCNGNELEITPVKNIGLDSPRTPKMQDYLSPSGEFVEPKKPSVLRKAQKRGRSPTLDDENSPVPNKKPATPGRLTPRTPERKRTRENSNTPGSARRVLGSIERSLNRVRHVLTPRKQAEAVGNQPLVLTNKDLCNVSTTQSKDPEFVISELSKALENKGIQCSRKGYRLKGSLEPNSVVRLGGCSFELEICYLPNLGPGQITPTKTILKKGILKTPNEENSANCNPTKLELASFVGIRRKRLKGDSWCYKKVCEEVLALTATEFRQIAESSV